MEEGTDSAKVEKEHDRPHRQLLLKAKRTGSQSVDVTTQTDPSSHSKDEKVGL